MEKIVKCKICGHSKVKVTKFTFDESYAHHLKFATGYRTFCYCNHCDFAFYYEYFNEKELYDLYHKNYRDHNIYNFETGGEPFHRFSYNQQALAQLLLARQFHDFKGGENMLDIGCGKGLSFWTAQNILPKMNYDAVEIGSQAVKYIEQINVRVFNDNFLKIHKRLNNNYYDLIVMSHSLEHFNSHDLSQVAYIINKKLKTSGLIVVEVPFHEVPLQHKNNSNKFLPDPTHLSFFSPKSIRILFENSGLQIKFVGCSGDRYESLLKKIENHKAEEKTKSKKKIKKFVVKISSKKNLYYLHLFKALKSGKDVFSIISSNHFDYSEDRIFIRIVALKK